MGLIRCGLCGHWITGETKRKATGKLYVYYHCAHRNCPAKSVYTPQSVIESQIIAAFEPFANFTPKATQSFIETLKQGMGDVKLTAHAQLGELMEKRAEVERGIGTLEKLHGAGQIGKGEYQEIMKLRKLTQSSVESEIQATLRADQKTVDAALVVIELIQKSYDLMRLHENLLEKARLAKIVLSNPVLENGTLRFT